MKEVNRNKTSAGIDVSDRVDDIAYKKTIEELMEITKSNLTFGLNEVQVQEKRGRFGLNLLPEAQKESLWKRIVSQFEDLMVRILLVAAIVSFIIALSDRNEEGITAFVEPFVILAILIANATIGVLQEQNAENALEALKNMQPEYATVIREGATRIIPAKDLVPGDLVKLRVGEKVPADIRLFEIESAVIRAEEASLTGENKPITKETNVIEKADGAAGKKNMLFSSTMITYGYGKGVVTGTGINTEVGKIAKLVEESEEEKSPLKKKLDQFGSILTYAIMGICFLVWAMNINNFFDPVHKHWFRGCIYYFKIAVSLAVAAIPEGLPAVITTCLALGTKRMARAHCIVRKLPSVETLGCTTVICSDKTGTLTMNRMEVRAFFTIDNAEEVIPNEFQDFWKQETVEAHGVTPMLKIARICALCSNAEITAKGKRMGDPTELALRDWAEKIGAQDKNFEKSGEALHEEYCTKFIPNEYKKLCTLEFSRERKCMSVLVKNTAANDNSLYIKGSPEAIINSCNRMMLREGGVVDLTEKHREMLTRHVDHFAEKALRCLAFSYKPTEDLGDLKSCSKEEANQIVNDPDQFSKFEGGGILLGVAGIIDPQRPEVKQSLVKCKTAGIRVHMITGDNIKTAYAIAEKIGIVNSFDSCYLGSQFAQMGEEERKGLFMQDKGLVFARVEPAHKKDMVYTLKQLNEIVAMTGDGVNDAPALKEAHIGVAMGITGTDVAKEASDMILADDNFSTIVKAVEEGRSIYSNTKAFIRYLISSNIGEVATIFFTAMLGLPESLTSVQLLWVNLVTDGMPATALGFNPPETDVMEKPPREHDEPIISSWTLIRYMIIGIYVGCATVLVFVQWYMWMDNPKDGHTMVSWKQLSNWSECTNWIGTPNELHLDDYMISKGFSTGCDYFTKGKTMACTLALSVLVMIEMLNSLNALSENDSLFTMPPWRNPWLILAIFSSVGAHCLILYVPIFNVIFGILPLGQTEWIMVMTWSAPVLLIDEILKFITRIKVKAALNKRLAQEGHSKLQ